MPTLKPNENYESWMQRCVPVLVDEGKDNDEAVAICDSMYDQQSNNMQRLIKKYTKYNNYDEETK